MDSYRDHKLSRPDYPRFAEELERSAALARIAGRTLTAASLEDHAAHIRAELGIEEPDAMEFLFRV